jgi:hypothetical protein
MQRQEYAKWGVPEKALLRTLLLIEILSKMHLASFKLRVPNKYNLPLSNRLPETKEGNKARSERTVALVQNIGVEDPDPKSIAIRRTSSGPMNSTSLHTFCFLGRKIEADDNCCDLDPSFSVIWVDNP